MGGKLRALTSSMCGKRVCSRLSCLGFFTETNNAPTRRPRKLINWTSAQRLCHKKQLTRTGEIR